MILPSSLLSSETTRAIHPPTLAHKTATDTTTTTTPTSHPSFPLVLLVYRFAIQTLSTPACWPLTRCLSFSPAILHFPLALLYVEPPAAEPCVCGQSSCSSSSSSSSSCQTNDCRGVSSSFANHVCVAVCCLLLPSSSLSLLNVLLLVPRRKDRRGSRVGCRLACDLLLPSSCSPPNRQTSPRLLCSCPAPLPLPAL